MLALGLLLLVLAIGVATYFTFPPWLRGKLIASIKKGCPQCEVRVGALSVSWLERKIALKDFNLDTNPERTTSYRVHARQMRADVASLGWLGSSPTLRSVRIEGLELTISRKQSPPGTEGEKTSFKPHLPAYRVEEAEIRDAKLVFLDHRRANTTGRVEFDQIDVDIGPFGTRPQLSPKSVPIHLHARAGGSGRASIDARVGLFSESERYSLDLTLRNVDLSDYNSYFVPMQGVRVHGLLTQGHARLKIRDRDLSGPVKLTYENLKLDFIAGKAGQSPVSAALKELAASLTVSEQNVAAPPKAAQVRLQRNQKPGESTLAFILSGLKDAALQILKS